MQNALWLQSNAAKHLVSLCHITLFLLVDHKRNTREIYRFLIYYSHRVMRSIAIFQYVYYKKQLFSQKLIQAGFSHMATHVIINIAFVT